MYGIRNLLKGAPILPIVQADTVEQALAVAEAVKNSGLKNIEVVRRTAVAADAVTAIRQKFPELVVGMGTILTTSQIAEAKAAGSQFIVTPTVSPTLLQALVEAELPFIPGTANAADILMAAEFGVKELKFFPAHLNGGAPMLKALSSIFQNIVFCPTGGVTQQNMTEYLALPNVFAVGGSWMLPTEMVKAGNWQGLTDLCAQALSAFDNEAAA
ncbi:bifunctional 4-hydroxy-2-oxoglutarate aldolase/2-dehydro-3-deoxy-phosphogluconate aldolase [Alteromonas pelagimontana]|uniref:Bifunctional 4-hydroxy-2-oxoglutarate aldolase/2-dehydro-3-deoxy-phosphogluconate aldolase n=1 Tax=Alteromonas pelagimontana TaxID=1858656 RepID=A0A6M4MDL9_9ALTE|nr:bifunctional 4-hydroxy-2-oxoglutarate aldolase/2-dehydro-3-deoxy-phosphogluconate aldolase [Alteromonas pelagimontana]QJR81117.1 bifunctional 4-hydroxy-2-oxoglutarate aldolase/2-dehydro-3-deoxy-phosphogluconate aldolase [Alteromonas pelagimontana]